ncbi:hypothetical protein [Brevibacillus choshinensis]|uniref:hypothetical protein n=1 Tax=Brevibacillus choshinensis TaxID=54911 RepID=UPI002E22DC93|nr:hypothetical protein [Brevibacillus choshinensis]MED4752485.1 hypothetical protein [Brevibacillus choshinensis]
MLPLLLALSLTISLDSTISVSPSHQMLRISRELATQEFDAYVRHWQKGQKLQLNHPLFSLTKVSAGPTSFQTITFTGHTNGLPGEVSLTFYTMDGDQVFTPPGTVKIARVDAEQREFHVDAVVPRLLIGRTGAIQVTFSGEGGKRAAYYVKAEF